MKFKFKKLLPKSLLGRTLLIMILPIIVAQIIAVYIFYERHWQSVSLHMAGSLAGELALIATQVEANPDIDLSIYEDNLSVQSVKLGNFPSSRGAGWKKISYKPYYNGLKGRLDNEFSIYRSTDERFLLTRIKIDEDKWLEIITSNKRLFNSTTYIFILWMLGSTTLLTLVAALFLKNQIRPIIRLARSADVFGRGQDLPTGFKPEGAHEVKTASEAFIKMQERIRRFIRQRTEMLAGISHDLRTPLTRLKLQIEMLRGKVAENEIIEMTKDIEEMKQMIDSYINFVRSAEEEDSKEVNIAETLRDVVAKFKAQNAQVEMADLQDCVLYIKENSITRAVSNLVGNAVKYAERARVSGIESKDFYSIIIEDNGAGIPEPERELVLRPFYRIENSRNPETGGSGLGLAIVQDIVNSHGGTLELADSEDLGGLRITIKLPK